MCRLIRRGTDKSAVDAPFCSARFSSTALSFHGLLANINHSSSQPQNFPSQGQSVGEALFQAAKTLRRRRVFCPKELLIYISQIAVGFGETKTDRTVFPVSPSPWPTKQEPHSQCPYPTSSKRAGKSPTRTSTPACHPTHANPLPRLRNDPFPTEILETPTRTVARSHHTRRPNSLRRPKNCSSRPRTAVETHTLSISRPTSSSASLVFPS